MHFFKTFFLFSLRAGLLFLFCVLSTFRLNRKTCTDIPGFTVQNTLTALSLLSVRDIIKCIVTCLLLFSLPTIVSAQDIPLEVQETFYGNYRQAMHGVSLYQDITAGTFDLDIPSCASGAPQIEHAYFIWQQRWRNSSGSNAVPVFDDNFEVTVGSNPQFTVNANETYIAMNPADVGQTTHLFTGYTDVTTIISSQLVVGTNTIQIDNLASPTPGGSLDENWGVGLIVIYECPEFDEVTIQTSVGSDFFLCERDGVAGDYSHISCFEFSMPLTSDIDAKITGMFGGQANSSAPFRGGNICYLTGSGTLPGNSGTNVAPSGDVVTDMNAVCSDNPTWTSSLGTEWDEFDIDITIPSGSAWICLQSHSVRGTNSARCGSLAAATYSILYEDDVFDQGTMPCTNPTTTAYALGASCTGGTPNDDGYLQISAADNATHYDYSIGSSYSGAGFSSATAFDPATDLPLQFGTLPNPTGSQAYTIRVFNGDSVCFTDMTLSLNEQDCNTGCDCKEYIYLNEPQIGSVLKFEVDPNAVLLNEIVQANGGTPPNEHWYPGTEASELPSPHGLATDLNGNLYIGSSFNIDTPIRKFNCDGTIQPIDGLTINNPYILTNIFSIGNTLYTTRSGGPASFDLCTGTELGTMCLNDDEGTPLPFMNNTSPGNVNWGLSYNSFTQTVYATGQRADRQGVWAYSKAELDAGMQGGACIDPLIWRSETITLANLNVGDNLLPSDADQLNGIVGDNDGNIYLAGSLSGGQGYVLRYNSAGQFQASATLNPAFQLSRGIVWSSDTDRVYVANLTDAPVVDCISVFDAATMNYLGTGAPNPNLPGNNGAKALSILKECCPVNNRQTVDQTYCVAGGNEKLFLNELFPCEGGIICEAQWTPVDAPSTSVFESCDQSIQENLAAGCYSFTRSSDGLNGKLCGAFEQTFNLEIVDVGTVSVSADQDVCVGDTPGQLSVTTTTSGTIQWQMSTTSCSTGFTDIPGANALSYQPGVLPGTTYFKVIINENGACSSGSCNIESDCITVNVSGLSQTGEATVACNDNGTSSDPTDDYITFSLNPGGVNLGSTYSVSVNNGGSISVAGGGNTSSISYGAATDFRLQNGSTDGSTTYTITITDNTDGTCQLTTSLMQNSCSDACSLTDAGESLEICNDNSTIYDGFDDYITFSLNPTGFNTATSYSVTADNGGMVSLQTGGPATNVNYGSATAFRLQDGSADGSTNYTITITDNSDNTCQTTTTVMQNSCELPSYSLGNRVFFDDNIDGIQNGTEAGVDGVELQLLNGDGTVYDSDPTLSGIQALTVTTANGGYYRFDNLAPDDYIVEILPTAFTSGNVLDTYSSSNGAAQEANPNNDVDLNDNGLDIPVAGAVRSGIITLGLTEPLGEAEPPSYAPESFTGTAAADSESNLTVDFGFYRQRDRPDCCDTERPPCTVEPCHFISNDIYFGSGVTNDPNSNTNAAADTDADDGLLWGENLSLSPGGTLNLPVSIYNNTGNNAYFRVWIDWNNDGDFEDPNEQVTDETYLAAVYSGSFTINYAVTIPMNVVQNQNLALRMRLSSDDTNTAAPCGNGNCANDGEIEDYLLRFNCPEQICRGVNISVRSR